MELKIQKEKETKKQRQSDRYRDSESTIGLFDRREPATDSNRRLSVGIRSRLMDIAAAAAAAALNGCRDGLRVLATLSEAVNVNGLWGGREGKREGARMDRL